MSIEDANDNPLFENNPEREFWRDTMSQKISEIINEFDPESRIVLMHAVVDYTDKDTGKKVSQDVVLFKDENFPLAKHIGFVVEFSNDFINGALEEKVVNIIKELRRRANILYN